MPTGFIYPGEYRGMHGIEEFFLFPRRVLDSTPQTPSYGYPT